MSTTTTVKGQYKLSGNEMEKDQMQPNIFFPFFTVVNWTWMLL